MRSPNYNLVESVGGLLGLCWVSVGSLISPWNTISFQSSSQNGLSKKALQMSSPNWDLFRVRFARNLLEDGGCPLEVRREFAGISPGVRWESAGIHLEFAGSLLGIHLESAGIPLGVCWEFIKWSLQKSSPNKVTKLQPGWVCWEPSRSLLGACWESDFPIKYYQLPKQFFKWTLKIGFPKKLSKWALQIETCLEFAGSLVEVWWKSGGSPLGVPWESIWEPAWVTNDLTAFLLFQELLQP